MGTRVAEARNPPQAAQSVPTTGMRGGLGRTLLTAFLILTILPLALIGGYVSQYYRRNLQEEVKDKLQAVATLKGEELRQWLEHVQQYVLSGGGDVSGADRDVWWMAVRAQEPGLVGAFFLDQGGQRQWSLGACPDTSAANSGENLSMLFAVPADSARFSPGRFFLSSADFQTWLSGLNSAQEMLVFCLNTSTVEHFIRYDVLTDQALIGESGRAYLVSTSRVWPGGELSVLTRDANGRAILPDGGLYVNHDGIQVVGALYYLDAFGIGVLVEQAQAETLKSSDRIAATVIALVLAVALATTAIAAVVIRQITRPVIQLTESAVAMAEGDLAQHLAVTSRDEIGILTYVFNEMAADLKSLYDDLEAKVAERTQRLQEANYLIQRRALHLQASQEVGQAITSLRDTQLLLDRVVELIRDNFVYTSVAMYIVEPGGGEIRLRALSPSASEGAARQSSWNARVYAGDGSIIERAVRKRTSQVEQYETDEAVEWYRRTLSRVAVPLRMGEQVLGVLAVSSIEREEIQRDELEVLELLAGQVAIALENAKAYERERSVTQQLEDAEVYKARFMANMSHELREPLNTIIGFSRLMIKGLDGEMTEQQVQDLERIYNDGQRLLFLINDILVISQIQAGMMELKLERVQMAELIEGVMPTASALVRGKDIELVKDVPEGLPPVHADPGRVRQMLVHLLNNAAKFTESGQIVIRAWRNEDQVYTSVSDTGVGIPPEDRERIFVRFEKGAEREGRRQRGVGLGLALCKEFVTLHGGQIWVNSEVGQGSTFTFSLPCYTDDDGRRGL